MFQGRLCWAKQSDPSNEGQITQQIAQKGDITKPRFISIQQKLTREALIKLPEFPGEWIPSRAGGPSGEASTSKPTGADNAMEQSAHNIQQKLTRETEAVSGSSPLGIPFSSWSDTQLLLPSADTFISRAKQQ